MTRRLYIYDHCPFCVKARMIFGLKRIPIELVVLLNDDEAGPVRMVGKKMVPILEEEGRYLGESMDIVARIEGEGEPVLTGPTNPAVSAWLGKIGAPLYRLFLPRAAAAPLPEFATTAARAYFIRNKENAAHPFGEILKDGAVFLEEINGLLRELAGMVRSAEAVNGVLSVDDIHLFPVLRSLSIIRGIVFPPEVEAYRQAMSVRANVGLLDDLAA